MYFRTTASLIMDQLRKDGLDENFLALFGVMNFLRAFYDVSPHEFYLAGAQKEFGSKKDALVLAQNSGIPNI